MWKAYDLRTARWEEQQPTYTGKISLVGALGDSEHVDLSLAKRVEESSADARNMRHCVSDGGDDAYG